jgi:hypothetical protein
VPNRWIGLIYVALFKNRSFKRTVSMLIIDGVIIGNLFVSSKKYHRYHFTEHLHKVLLVTNTYRKSKDFSSTAVEYLIFFVHFVKCI